MPIEEFNLDLCPPAAATFGIVGSAIESARSISGVTSAIDTSGGGFVAVKYTGVFLGNTNRSALRYWSRLSALLASGVQPIIVPLLTDWLSPIPDGQALRLLSTYDDTGTFGDRGDFSQGSVGAWNSGVAAVAAGMISIKLQAGLILEGGEWFSILHDTLGHRAYCVKRIESIAVADSDGASVYTVSIRPTLREAVADGVDVNFVRPRCLMRLAPGTAMQLDIKDSWNSQPDIAFVEYPIIPLTDPAATVSTAAQGGAQPTQY